MYEDTGAWQCTCLDTVADYIFFHPDFTVGAVISTAQPESPERRQRVADYNRRSGLSPYPEDFNRKYSKKTEIFPLSAEKKPLAAGLFVEDAILIYEIAADKGMCDLRPDRAPGVRGPAALGVFGSIREYPVAVHVHDGKVGMVALTDEAAAVDVIEDGRIVAHEPDHLREGDPATKGKFSHKVQAVLDGRETGLAGEVVSGELLLPEVRSMVRADGVN